MIQSPEPATKRDLAKRVIRHALRAQVVRSWTGPGRLCTIESSLADRIADEFLEDLDRPFLYPALRVLAGEE